MYFHAVHGKNIVLSADSSQARRTSGFCQSVTFSNNTLIPFQRITFQILQSLETDTSDISESDVNLRQNLIKGKKPKKAIWSGGLRIGLTNKNPITLTSTDLPVVSFPNLVKREGFWITDLKSSYLKNGNKISLILDKDNSLQLYINYVLKATLFANHEIPSTDLLTKYWLILDLYGITSCIQFLPSDNTPYEIKARGLDAINNFHSACLTGGSKSIFKTRLIMFGQVGVGKTSLRNALVNLNYKKKKALGRLDASTSFRVSVDRKSNLWNLKNINIIDNHKSKTSGSSREHTASNLIQSRSVQNLQDSHSKEHIGLRDKHLSRKLSSSTSYLNEQDDYDDDMNKVEYLKKFKKQMSLEKVEKEPSITGLNGSIDEDLNKAQPTTATTADKGKDVSSDSDTNSENSDIDGTIERENLFAIDECDEKIMLNHLDAEKYEYFYREIAMNIYQELFTTKLYDKLWPSAIDTKNNTTNINEDSCAAINNFTESFFEKLALVEFDTSIYNQLDCSEFLREFYEKIVKNEIQVIQHKSNTILINPCNVKVNKISQENEKTFQHVLDKNLTLNILDFDGKSLFYTTHQIFLSSRAVYLICFDLTKDLDALAHSNFEFGPKENKELTNLEFLDFWMRSIHSHTAKIPDMSSDAANFSTKTSESEQQQQVTTIQLDDDSLFYLKNAVISPPIIIVGTNKNCIPADVGDKEEYIQLKFDKIKKFVANKVYCKHIVEPYLAIDASFDSDRARKKESASLSLPEQKSKLKDITYLKKIIELAAVNEPYMGEQQPLRWMKFEKSLEKLKGKSLFYASLSQICEIAHEKGITTQEELTTCLNFLHDLGNIIYYGNANDIFLRNTIILRPQKLVDIFKTVLNAQPIDHSLYLETQQSNLETLTKGSSINSQLNYHRSKAGNPLLFSQSTTSLDKSQWVELWINYDQKGILDERLLDFLFKNFIDQKPGLLGLMKKFDLICEKKVIGIKNSSNKKNFCKEYLVPGRATGKYEDMEKDPNKSTNLMNNRNSSSFVANNSQNIFRNVDTSVSNLAIVEFFYDFVGFLPESLFNRILTRAANWTLLKNDINVDTAVRLFWRKARYYLDESHDFIIEMSPLKFARIKIQVIRLNTTTNTGQLTTSDSSPDPNSCAKVRNFMESTLTDLRNLWMKRLIFNACVQCCCQKLCAVHQTEMCPCDDCIHFLNLDECLTNNIITCDYRRVKTMIYKNWFPTQNLSLHKGPVLSAVKSYSNKQNSFYDETNLPGWVKNVAKIISLGNNQNIKDTNKDGSSKQIVTVQNENDWKALARLLGYSNSKISYFMESKNPALQLLCDWIMSSDNTNLTIELLLNYLEQIKREDACCIINNEREKDTVNSSVFISYHWDSQLTVIKIKENLEKSGFKCFMDIGQIGGGNLLYQKIDQAIRNSQVIIACITPKFVVSHFCNREMALADLLRKPIVPIMLCATPWPPPGGMSLIFSQLVYVDYYGVGGHGGCGIQADKTQRNNEIVALVSRHIDPSSYFLMNIDRIVDNDSQNVSRSLKSRSSKKIRMRNSSSRRQSATLYRSGGVNNAGYSGANQENHRNNNSANEGNNNNRNGVGSAHSNRQSADDTAEVSRCMICNLL